MDKWQYLDLHVALGNVHINEVEAKQWKGRPKHEILDSLGQEGWELVGKGDQHGHHLLLKRRLLP
jgi:hypothetical protein